MNCLNVSYLNRRLFRGCSFLDDYLLFIAWRGKTGAFDGTDGWLNPYARAAPWPL